MTAEEPRREERIALRERRGIVRLELAMPAIDETALGEIEAALARIEEAAGRGEIRGLVLAGGPRGLPGGPAPALFEEKADEQAIAAFAARGGEIARRIERLPVPVVAVLAGQALDAGLELLLAAPVRIGRAGRGLAAGLPGPDAALPPLFGGLSRLIEICGLGRALEIVLDRRRLTAARALATGLVNELAPEELLDERALARVDELAAAWRAGLETRPSPRRVGLADYLVQETAFFRRLELGRLRRRAADFARPAALSERLIRETEARFELPRFERLERESRAAAAIAAAPETRKRLALLLRGDDRLRGGPYAPAGAEIRLPQRVAIFGAGKLGSRLALALLGRGMRVALYDPFAEALVAARNRVDGALDDLVARGRLQRAAADRVRDRLFLAEEPASLRDCDLVVECVPEVLALKQDILRRIAAIDGGRPILVSHSVSLAPDDLLRVLPAGRRLQVMHLPMPEEPTGYCEIVRARDAAHAELAVLVRLAREIGRFPLVSSGPAPNAWGRLLAAFVGEALRLFAEGFSPRTIDRAARDFGFAQGPLELLDHVGLEIVLAISRRLAEDPLAGFQNPEALTALVERGETGRQRGIGIRIWRERGSLPRNESELRRSLGLPALLMDQDERLALRRLLDPLRFTGRRLLEAGVIGDRSELDLLSVHGLGFPAGKGGLASFMEGEE